MSNFKLLTPYLSNYSSSSASGFASSSPAGYGQRRDRLANTSASTSSYVQFNLTAATAIDFVYIANLDLSCRLIDPTDLTITIKGSTVSNFASSEDITYSVGLSDLLGRYLRDWVHSLAFTTSYQYYRVEISGTSNKWAVGKIWIGSSVDLGSPYIRAKITQAKIEDGHQEALREFRFKFYGLTSTQKNDYYEKVEKYHDFSDCVLWDVDDSVFTSSETLLYCKLFKSISENRAGVFHDLDLSFREVY